MEETVIDHRGLGAQTHHLIGGRLIAGDTVSPVGEILDQLGAGSLVLDQHDSRTEQHLALTHGALEHRVFEPPAEHTVFHSLREDAAR